MSKKFIGVTGPSKFTPQVLEMVEEFFNAIPIEINTNKTENIKQIFDLCDAIIFSGGVDIFPATLEDAERDGEKREIERGNGYSKFDRARDNRELELIRLCEEAKKPYMGICRGHQLILSNRGLYLMEDISGSSVMHSPAGIEVEDEPLHYVRGYKRGEKEFFKAELCNSFHHQSIYFDSHEDYSKFGVEVLGLANVNYKRGQEAELRIIEMAAGENFLTCQFHPEWDYRKNRASQIFLEHFKKRLA